MNKNHILLITVLLFSNFLIGQDKKEDKKHNFAIGINIGPNYNSLRGDSFADRYDSQFNYFFGFSFEYIIDENFSILNNINYENKSYKSEYKGFDEVWTNTFEAEDITKIKNLNIPIFLKYKFGFEKEFHLNGGLFYNHILDISNEKTNKETGENLDGLDFNYLFKDKEFGVSIGIGSTFNLNQKSNLTIEVRNDFGLNDIGDTSSGGISKTRTNTIKFIVNWNLTI